MNIKKDFQFFTNILSAQNSLICSVPNNVSTLVLQISSTTTPTFSLNVGGIMNDTTSTFTTLESINMSTNAISTDISAVGIYIIPIDGISNVEVMLTSITSGSISVYGKFGE